MHNFLDPPPPNRRALRKLTFFHFLSITKPCCTSGRRGLDVGTRHQPNYADKAAFLKKPLVAVCNSLLGTSMQHAVMQVVGTALTTNTARSIPAHALNHLGYVDCKNVYYKVSGSVMHIYRVIQSIASFSGLSPSKPEPFEGSRTRLQYYCSQQMTLTDQGSTSSIICIVTGVE